jgi:hypothetical protein
MFNPAKLSTRVKLLFEYNQKQNNLELTHNTDRGNIAVIDVGCKLQLHEIECVLKQVEKYCKCDRNISAGNMNRTQN